MIGGIQEKVNKVEKDYIKNQDINQFRIGDTVRIHYVIREGDKERVQIFQGILIRIKKNGLSSTFTVRKTSYGVGVERIYPFYSPLIQKVDVTSRGKVRRSKLYFLRDKKGKSARLRESGRVINKTDNTVPETTENQAKEKE